MTAGASDESACGPWHPGISSQIPRELLHLATVFRPEHVSTALTEAEELAEFTGLPAVELVAFRPERLALHELLVRVTADVSVPDGERIEDLGINFRAITRVLLERHVNPRMASIAQAHESVRARVAAIVERELAPLFAPAAAASPPARPGCWPRRRRSRRRSPWAVCLGRRRGLSSTPLADDAKLGFTAPHKLPKKGAMGMTIK